MLEQSGFADIQIGPPVDTFGGAGGESKARLFEVCGHAFWRTDQIVRCRAPFTIARSSPTAGGADSSELDRLFKPGIVPDQPRHRAGWRWSFSTCKPTITLSSARDRPVRPS